MAKLLVVGMGPLLEKGVRNFGGQCLRTWYFTKPLLDDGNTVRLVTIPIFDPGDPDRHKAALVRRKCEGFEYQGFTNCDFDFIHETLTNVARSFNADAIIAVNNLPSWVAARLPVTCPLWADLNGYEMAEKQGQAARTRSDEPLYEAWRRESLVTRRADKFSTVSRPQLHALLGELATVGRLNRFTFHYHFIHHMPNAYHPAFARTPAADRKPVVRGKAVPEDAFIVLWTGGYNYWTDPKFLFDFLEATIASHPSIHFVSTGGRIEGYNTQTYDEFAKLVEGSRHKNRYHLLGWVDAEELPRIYREADLGLNIDEPNYETFFGARNRLNNMMAAGVPVLTTYGSEISRLIDEARCGLVSPAGDISDMVRQVLTMLKAPEQRAKIGERARGFAESEFSAEALTLALRRWASHPSHSPDNLDKLHRHPGLVRLVDVHVNHLEAVAAVADKHDPTALLAEKQILDALRARPWYRAARFVKRSVLFCGNAARATALAIARVVRAVWRAGAWVVRKVRGGKPAQKTASVKAGKKEAPPAKDGPPDSAG